MPRPIDPNVPHHWRKISREKEILRPALGGDVDVEFAVLGGGFTGLAAALELRKAGAQVVVLEQSRIGQAASGRNNGQVIPHHSKAAPSEIRAVLGEKRGDAYNLMVASAAETVFRRIAEYGIACDGVQQGWMQACHSEAALARARAFVSEWQALGASVAFVPGDELAERAGTRNYAGGWRATTGGHVNPYALVLGLARAAEAAGCTIYEQTQVVKLSPDGLGPDGEGWLIQCANAAGAVSGRVRAGKIIIATNALTGNFWPDLARVVIPVRVFQAATGPISGNLLGTVMPANMAMSDTRRDIRAYRRDAVGSLVTGGTHTVWQDAEARGKRKVARHLYETFPQLNDRPIQEYWEGVLGVVPDRLPRMMRIGKNALFAGIYSGRGVALSQQVGALAARLLTDQTTEDESPVPVTPLRTVPSHGIAVQVARFIHPLHRIQDRLDR
ncbi:NAD(P)/FAD-dependent oxidoreductase [Rhodoligotrophos defluvii]|uniref:NAD(P)/FAD-dependent oxidoreductase n=1 Tax=Rhodoligotrophos defluvii TaxID=2561934 RepID=UPI0010C9875F|nr:FAD-dependent oxidoreductase [Rhodoligotrophos defluvii]